MLCTRVGPLRLCPSVRVHPCLLLHGLIPRFTGAIWMGDVDTFYWRNDLGWLDRSQNGVKPQLEIHRHNWRQWRPIFQNEVCLAIAAFCSFVFSIWPFVQWKSKMEWNAMSRNKFVEYIHIVYLCVCVSICSLCWMTSTQRQPWDWDRNCRQHSPRQQQRQQEWNPRGNEVESQAEREKI